MKITSAERILDQLEGATIVSHYVEDDEGLHICMADGRVLIIAGMFVISMMRLSEERLH